MGKELEALKREVSKDSERDTERVVQGWGVWTQRRLGR